MVEQWRIEAEFPKLQDDGYTITSPETSVYNCIAWAANDDENWWWPRSDLGYYWPPSAKLEESLNAFINAFESIGYIVDVNCQLEPGFEKIAIYVDSNGRPTHAARQLPDGQWTSKLGPWDDIKHTLDGLTDSLYGTISQIMKRPV